MLWFYEKTLNWISLFQLMVFVKFQHPLHLLSVNVRERVCSSINVKKYLVLFLISSLNLNTEKKNILCVTEQPQYAHDVVLTCVRRRFNVMDVVWMSKRCRVLTGTLRFDFIHLFVIHQHCSDLFYTESWNFTISTTYAYKYITNRPAIVKSK